ncbi:hypothetical protein WMF31_04940 [Sorangium sp. So ce1036]|uniref:hypothetical protein n=1 Tax=Sorangium sp. So ce1036 TaxID=3133328 RepID=UPI003F0797D4
MFSTDAPQPASEEARPSKPLSPLGAMGVALSTAALVFTLGVYTVEEGLSARTARSREVPPASAAVTGFARFAVAASLRAAVPVQPGASPSASAIDDAAGPARPMPPPAPSAEAASPPPAPTPSAESAPPPPTPSAEAAPPPPTPSAESAPPPKPSAESAPPPKPSAPRIPRRGHGMLQLNTAQNATVYVTGVAVGPSNQPIEVRCGRFFVRLGEPTRHGTRWLAEGRTVVVKCGELTEVSF